MNLDDANVADEYGPERFMPREVDGGAAAEVRVTDDSVELTIHVCMPSLGEPCGRPCHRCAITDHEFRPVNGHPDDDECTFGGLAFYCGATRERHTAFAEPDPEPVECEHCCGSGNTKVHVKGATADAPCTPCAGQGITEADR